MPLPHPALSMIGPWLCLRYLGKHKVTSLILSLFMLYTLHHLSLLMHFTLLSLCDTNAVFSKILFPFAYKMMYFK